ncbi:hypothetical protein LCGC14_2980800 [marine sediment metagenome]|uniref:Uncharacterized protein n=1 Tax=marine sediment metagenome TaxID=412755 RepID=A0A0F8ZXV3_9ZZZZ
MISIIFGVIWLLLAIIVWVVDSESDIFWYLLILSSVWVSASMTQSEIKRSRK